MKYAVSRQRYWGVEPEDGTVVEIAVGGIDYMNPDALGARWPGELQEFDDPREAVEAAIKIKDAWLASGESNAKVAYGCTMGFTMPMDAKEDDQARAWAEQAYEKLPKCRECANVLPKHPYGNEHTVMLDNEYPFCSEHCADKDEIFQCQAEEELNGTPEQPEKF